MSSFLPEIGTTGIFTLNAPFTNDVKVNTTYTVLAVKKISEVIAGGEDPYELFYKPKNLTRTEYNEDSLNDICIVSLQSGLGEWVYVPQKYIASFPNVNGVVYRVMMLGINLGAVPDTFNISALKTKIQGVVLDTLGVNSVDIKEISVSSPAVISKEDHDILENARLLKIQNSSSDYARLQYYMELCDKQATKISSLENYILDNLN